MPYPVKIFHPDVGTVLANGMESESAVCALQLKWVASAMMSSISALVVWRSEGAIEGNKFST